MKQFNLLDLACSALILVFGSGHRTQHNLKKQQSSRVCSIARYILIQISACFSGFITINFFNHSLRIGLKPHRCSHYDKYIDKYSVYILLASDKLQSLLIVLSLSHLSQLAPTQLLSITPQLYTIALYSKKPQTGLAHLSQKCGSQWWSIMQEFGNSGNIIDYAHIYRDSARYFFPGKNVRDKYKS